ncbi:hypothetical protein [Paraburkholderia sp.]|nr:hypothetical protein [Paraburkholderia sp.]
MFDHYARPNAPEWSTVSSDLIGEISRASNAISTISRLVHNSLCETVDDVDVDVVPLGHEAHCGLLNAADLIGQYLHQIAGKMHDQAHAHVEKRAKVHHG